MKNILLALLLLLGTTAFAQNTEVNLDSLHQVWLDESQPDTIRFQAYYNYIWKGFLRNNPDSAFKLSENILEFAQQSKNRKLEATSYKLQGISQEYRSKFILALRYYENSIKIYEAINDKMGISNVNNNIGIVYYNQGKIKEALEYIQSSLEIKEELGDIKKLGTLYNNLGMIYYEQGENEKALEYYNLALKINLETNNSNEVANSLNQLGRYYSNQVSKQEGLKYYLRSLNIYEKNGNNFGVMITLNNIGVSYERQKNLLRAKENYERSLKIAEEIGDKQNAALYLNNIGSVYFNQEIITKAQEYTNRALDLAIEIGTPEKINMAAGQLKRIYKRQENFKLAFEMQELEIQMKDSLKSDEVAKQIAQTESRSEFEKELLIKEQEEKEAALATAEIKERRNRLEYSGIAFALLVLFGLVFVIGHFSLPKWAIEFSVFLPILVLFEFVLVLTDPFVEAYTGGDPMVKLLINAAFAGLIFPLHGFFESFMKKRLIKAT